MNPEVLQIHAERIRLSGILGRSDLMLRLFEFLVTCSLNGKTPKEIEIAIDVFGKDADFEVTRDAMVRVYMHKLRRKLEEYYADAGRDESSRLTIPRGEYRLVFEDSLPAEATPASSDAATPLVDEPGLDNLAIPTHAVVTSPPSAAQRMFPWRYAAIGLAALMLINGLVWLVVMPSRSSVAQELDTVRDMSVWTDIVSDDQPVTVVLGDYYIFGELGTPSATNPELVERLVRDFGINSRSDLEQTIKDHPDLADRYMDVALRYLPVSAAFALSDVVRLLEPNRKNPRQVQLVLASDLTPDMIRSTHIVYVGLLSGMGMLRDIAFAGSQYKIGETYDELIDRKTNKLYVSQANFGMQEKSRYRDYGYFSTFAGPTGNRIVILAGTRDAALMHTAEAVSRSQSLRELIKRAQATDFEALYAVEGIDQINLDGQLVATEKLDATQIWTGGEKAKSIAIAHANGSDAGTHRLQ